MAAVVSALHLSSVLAVVAENLTCESLFLAVFFFWAARSRSSCLESNFKRQEKKRDLLLVVRVRRARVLRNSQRVAGSQAQLNLGAGALSSSNEKKNQKQKHLQSKFKGKETYQI